MNKEQAKIKITEEDLKFIYGADYNFFQTKILSNCYCHNCQPSKHNATINNYEIFINDLDDVILCGFCAECGGKMNRYLETGEVKEYLPRIKKIKRKHAK